MTPERLQEIQELFIAASELPAAEREPFLDERCAGDPELRRDVMALLESLQRSGRFDQLAAEISGPGGEPAVSELPPLSQVGPYKILHEIGHGGMGTVYLAERTDGGFEQQVALKLLRGDLHSEELRQRFLAERQILARVSHANIAHLLDGGVTDAGQPFFVMERIEGVPIDSYCDDKRLSIDERLRLFRTVCSAVHYAHRHLVVHRDLKPGNILVAADGTVKLLDFGIAKLLDPESSASPQLETRTGVRIMTPEYASPEQVRGDAITTASDVYQLGVLLFELLTGHRPYRLSGRSLLEVERIISETEPDRPSAAVTRIEEFEDVEGKPAITPEDVSHARGTTADKLRRRLAGDLDNIVMMAMRKEPERRYASAEQLADDVRRHQEGLPVAARADTVGYRASKFVRRHKIGVATTVAGFVAIIGFAVAMGIQAERTARERDKAEQVTAFLVGLFESSDPRVTLGDTVTVREVLDRGAGWVGVELADQPEVRATLMQVLGKVYHSLGLIDEAAAQWEAALELRERTLDPDHPDLGLSLNDLGMLRSEAGKLEEAEPLLRRAVAILRAAGKQDRAEFARSLNNLGFMLQVKGEYDEAVSAYGEALVVYRQAAGDQRSGIATIHMNMGWIKTNQGDLEAAETHFREALAIRRERYAAEHPHIAKSLSSLATLLWRKGDYEAAESEAREALALTQMLYPEPHQDVAESLLSLANIMADRGDYDTADSLFEAAIVTYGQVFGSGAPHVARVKNDFAGRLSDRGEFERADPLYREALPVYRDVLGNDHPFTAIVKGNLASALYGLSETDEAERLWREAIATLREASVAPTFAVRPLIGLASLLMDRDAYREAEPLLREALSILKDAPPDTRWQVVEAQSRLGDCLVVQRRFEEAESLFLDSYTQLREERGLEDPNTQQALERLAGLYDVWGRPAEADRYRRLRVRSAE
jgi:serine/threonine-protein kinase